MSTMCKQNVCISSTNCQQYIKIPLFYPYFIVIDFISKMSMVYQQYFSYSLSPKHQPFVLRPDSQGVTCTATHLEQHNSWAVCSLTIFPSFEPTHPCYPETQVTCQLRSWKQKDVDTLYYKMSLLCPQNVDILKILKCQQNVCSTLRQIVDKIKAVNIMVTNNWHFADIMATIWIINIMSETNIDTMKTKRKV